ncbi:MAG TPA: hypothetical protein VKT49_08785 [Bryobacteraceae bacterium]|nr:hypothetical protein [Bryobacteraceae bacterium]
MNLGVDDPKKVTLLVALAALGGYLAYSNLLSGPSSSPSASVTQAPAPQAPVPAEAPRSAPSISRYNRSRVQSDEFHPVLHSKRAEDRIDPGKVDPTLRLDLLAKVQEAGPAAPGRNVFQFGQAPLPPEPKVVPKAPPQPAVSVAVNTPSPAPSSPPAPPITLRYYGFTSVPGSNTKTAFFLDGDEILVGKEGETLKRRYRVVRIGATSVVMEDTQSKHEQTIPLAEEAAG